MDSPEFNLLISVLLIPIVIWIHGSLGSTLVSTLGEGVAVLSSLILIIWIAGSILRYLFPAIFGAPL